MDKPDGWAFPDPPKTKKKKKKLKEVSITKAEPKLTRKEVANVLKKAVARRFIKQRYGVNFELGINKWGKRRADVVALSVQGKITIVEVKSCVQDFVTDSKCDQYLPYANQLYFAFTGSTWEKLKDRVEFPPEVGVMTYRKTEGLKVVKSSKKREIETKNLISIALRLGYRGSKYKDLKDLL